MQRALVGLVASMTAAGPLLLAVPTTSASGATPVIVACTAFSGNISTGATASGCNQKSITGGGGSANGNASGTTFNITWKTGKTTNGKMTLSNVPHSTCPAKFRDELSSMSKVTGGTARQLRGGTTTNKICLNAVSGNFEVLPGTKYKI